MSTSGSLVESMICGANTNSDALPFRRFIEGSWACKLRKIFDWFLNWRCRDVAGFFRIFGVVWCCDTEVSSEMSVWMKDLVGWKAYVVDRLILLI